MSIGFIGAGKIAQSLIKGLVSAGLLTNRTTGHSVLIVCEVRHLKSGPDSSLSTQRGRQVPSRHTGKSWLWSKQPSQWLYVLVQALGCRTTYHNFDVMNNSEIVVLAVKPPVFPAILDDIKSSVTSKHLLISIALGITISSIENVCISTISAKQ